MQLDPELVAVLAAGAATASVLLLGLVAVLAVRLRRLRRAQQRVLSGGAADLVDVLDRQQRALDGLAGELHRARDERAELRAELARTVSRVAVVRYDAFEDMGGALSFSAALLDEHGHGLVVSAINGRAETRCYAKPVTAGASEHSLSAEEIEALAAALRGSSVQAPEPQGRRRRRAS